MIGSLIGKLTVRESAGTLNGAPAWLVRCECGNLRVVPETDLVHADVVSCGCDKETVRTSTRKDGTTVRSYQRKPGMVPPYSREEDETLLRMWGKHTTDQIAEAIGRSRVSVKSRIENLRRSGVDVPRVRRGRRRKADHA